ncbi:hypothetical protein FC686_12040 [Bacillus cereus]|nr:hypothetical protein FC686_12040 [Bacillus cereus]
MQSATNKSEAFNGFTKWLFFGEKDLSLRMIVRNRKKSLNITT